MTQRRRERGSATKSKRKPHAYDSYKNFKFRVRWEGRLVAGVSKVSGLDHSAKYEPITLQQGVTQDPEFANWAATVLNGKADISGPHPHFRKDLTIEVYTEAGQLALAYKVHRAWASDFQALPDLDGNTNSVAIRSLRLEHEGWE